MANEIPVPSEAKDFKSGHRLRLARQGSGMRLIDLERGINYSALSQVELGYVEPSKRVIQGYEQFLGIRSGTLMQDSIEIHPEVSSIASSNARIEYQAERSRELGIPEGSGKRYTEQELINFIESSNQEVVEKQSERALFPERDGSVVVAGIKIGYRITAEQSKFSDDDISALEESIRFRFRFRVPQFFKLIKSPTKENIDDVVNNLNLDETEAEGVKKIYRESLGFED